MGKGPTTINYNGWYAIKPNKNQIIYLIYVYKEDLALNNQQSLTCHKLNQTKSYMCISMY